jgi:DNA polymerase-3 subunit epsilon
MTRRFVAVGNDLGPGFGSYTIVDVETSGLDSTKHRVLSVAAVRLGVDGQVCDEYHTLVDPGCDPGPIHIHGLTREKLRGAPCFENIRHHLSKHLTGQVLVAHNAQHDYRFLAREFSLVGSTLPVPRRLCTLAFAHRVAVPTPDHKLRTLAAYYNVEQTRWHDALDDARVLAKILRALTADAARLGIPTPLLTCSPDDVVAGTTTPSGFNAMRYGPKQPCEYVCPGQFTGQLIQGMKFAITGDTTLERIELVRRAEMGGLDGTGCVSRQTSVIVANQPDRDCTKLRHAREFGTPLITEAQFLSLLQSIQGGIRKCDAAKASRAKPASRQRKSQPITTGPLSGRRMLVVGGTHDEAVLARLRIGELGGSTSVNMSATVTDV